MRDCLGPPRTGATLWASGLPSPGATRESDAVTLHAPTSPPAATRPKRVEAHTVTSLSGEKLALGMREIPRAAVAGRNDPLVIDG